MATPHNSAPEGAFAKTVLMPGDPLRAKLVADNFLEDAKLVTSVRNVYGYTGTYKGVPISVMASGMGMASLGIYASELYNSYGVENIIRFGTAGSYTDRLKVLDVVLADSAYSDTSFALIQNGETAKELRPSPEINKAIADKAKELGINYKLAKVHSSDVFYVSENGIKWKDLRDKVGVDCVEMESFALFHLANTYGKRAACLLTISDSFVDPVELTAEERQNSLTQMIKLTLEAAITL